MDHDHVNAHGSRPSDSYSNDMNGNLGIPHLSKQANQYCRTTIMWL